MRKLSTGQDSTIRGHLEVVERIFGIESKAADFLRQKAMDDPQGLDAEVIQDESQVMMLLFAIHRGDVQFEKKHVRAFNNPKGELN